MILWEILQNPRWLQVATRGKVGTAVCVPHPGRTVAGRATPTLRSPVVSLPKYICRNPCVTRRTPPQNPTGHSISYPLDLTCRSPVDPSVAMQSDLSIGLPL